MSFYKEVPGRKTTLESTLKFDTTPTAGSTNPVTSGGVAEAVVDASDALQEQIDEIAEKAGSGYIPKGPASVATLNGLTGQENGWLYTMTDAGTLTDGTLAVVAGDTVAWDATNEVWYKAMDYAPSQYGTNEIKNLPTTITAFRTSDVIPVDGTDGTAKMGKDDLLKATAESGLCVKTITRITNTNTYTSYNDLPQNSVTHVFTNLNDSPTPSSPTWGTCFTFTGTGTSSYKGQLLIAVEGSNKNFYWRACLNGTWNNWSRSLNEDDFSKFVYVGGNVSDASVYSELSDFPVNSVFLISTSSIPKPTGASTVGGVLLTYGSSASNRVQLYTDIGAASTAGYTWIRACRSGTWTDWKRLATMDDIGDTGKLIDSLLKIDDVHVLDTTGRVDDKFINKLGSIATSVNCWYLVDCVVVPPRTKFSILARGYSANVGMISKKIDSTTFDVLVISRSADPEVYEWSNDSDESVTISLSSLNMADNEFVYKFESIDSSRLQVSLTCFSSIGCLGDSYTAGQIYKNGSESVGSFDGKFSWPANLARETNIDVTNYGVGGATTHSAKTNAGQLPKILQDPAKDLYLLTLGINDYNRPDAATYLGTPEDMDTEDYTQSADTYYGNYYYIIKAIQEHAPNALVVMITPSRMSPDDISDYYQASLTIAQTAGIPCLPSYELKTYPVYENKIGGHPTIAGYSLMSRFYRQIIENYLNTNPSILNKMAWL